jgi:hypothetical protein
MPCVISLQPASKQISRSVDNVLTTEFEVTGTAETASDMDRNQDTTPVLSKSTEAISHHPAAEPAMVTYELVRCMFGYKIIGLSHVP